MGYSCNLTIYFFLLKAPDQWLPRFDISLCELWTKISFRDRVHRIFDPQF